MAGSDRRLGLHNDPLDPLTRHRRLGAFWAARRASARRTNADSDERRKTKRVPARRPLGQAGSKFPRCAKARSRDSIVQVEARRASSSPIPKVVVRIDAFARYSDAGMGPAMCLSCTRPSSK